MRRIVFKISFSTAFLLSAASIGALAQSQTPILGLGDSLGEGVQSNNASTVSQPHDYLSLISVQMGAVLSQPLIVSGPKGVAGSTAGRGRINPNAMPADLAVSGATTENVVSQVAAAGGTGEIDLVLPPYFGMSQLQIAEQVKPKTIFCWIGANDLIGYILDFGSLNNPSITPLAQFTAQYETLVAGLKTTGAQVVLGNIPDLTEVGYLLDNAQLQRYGGSQYSLPDGYLTPIETAFLLHLGIFGQKDLSNPAYVLSPAQITNIKQQVKLYNGVIAAVAAAAGFPVADVHGFQKSIIANPVTIQGFTITAGYNRGAFSLDGIHPSNIGYAFFANLFISAYNAGYGQSVPKISEGELTGILDKDPFIDWNGNGVVPGRPGTGLLESEGPLLGISGDTGDVPPAPGDASAFMQRYFEAKGLDPQTPWSNADVVKAVVSLFPSH